MPLANKRSQALEAGGRDKAGCLFRGVNLRDGAPHALILGQLIIAGRKAGRSYGSSSVVIGEVKVHEVPRAVHGPQVGGQPAVLR